MLGLSDLKNRVYEGKQCVSFDFFLESESQDEVPTVKLSFVRGSTENEWTMRTVLSRTREADSNVYTFYYVMPRGAMQLTLIAATGLRYFQMYLKNEVQLKMSYDFLIGEIIKGM